MVLVEAKRMVRRSWFWGVFGSASLFAVYFLTLTISNSLVHALEELRAIGIWIMFLTLGFGIQTGLFAYIRGALRARATAQATASMAATGGMSATAMVACCMHHLTDILPVLGVSAASLFLVRYQIFFLAVGVASSLAGIALMLRLVQGQDLYEPGHGILGRILKFDMSRVFVMSTLFGITLAVVTFIVSMN